MAVAGIAAYRYGVSDYVLFYSYGAMWICLYVTTSFACRPRTGADGRPDSFDPAR